MGATSKPIDGTAQSSALSTSRKTGGCVLPVMRSTAGCVTSVQKQTTTRGVDANFAELRKHNKLHQISNAFISIGTSRFS
jgi:hypothetical protein